MLPQMMIIKCILPVSIIKIYIKKCSLHKVNNTFPIVNIIKIIIFIIVKVVINSMYSSTFAMQRNE